MAQQVGPHPHRSPLAAGFVTFAAVMMVMIGVFGALQGLAAVMNHTFYVATPNYYVAIDVSAWGWIHLGVGVLVAFAGFGVMSGRTWARVVGIVLAILSGIANFMFIPYYPFWSLLIIALDVVVIWALAAHGREASL